MTSKISPPPKLEELREEDFVQLIQGTFDRLNELASSIMRTDRPSSERAETIRQVNRYLERKIYELEDERTATPMPSLRELRNELAHGSRLRKYPPKIVKNLQTQLWRGIEKSAPDWPPHELVSFLSYCLHTHMPDRELVYSEPRKIVKVFKAMFDSMEDERRLAVSEELAMRLFTDRELRYRMERAASQ